MVASEVPSRLCVEEVHAACDFHARRQSWVAKKRHSSHSSRPSRSRRRARQPVEQAAQEREELGLDDPGRGAAPPCAQLARRDPAST